MTPLAILPPKKPGPAGGRWTRVCLVTAALVLVAARARAIPAAPAGAVETGAPSFVVLGPEGLGLSSPPLDLHLMPDGRILVVSSQELAFGDGVRWETYRKVEGQRSIVAEVAVDDDGQVYSNMDGGVARLDLASEGRWQSTLVTKLPGGTSIQNAAKVSMFADQWYWYGGTDAVISWHPGQLARVAGKVGIVDRIFRLDGAVFLSDQSAGKIFRLNPDGTTEQLLEKETLVSESLTCATPFGPGQLLVGTVAVGLRLFDGKTFQPFGLPGLLRSGHRITDICPTGAGLFAAAVDTVGIVFFDREGRTVQILDNTLDRRLARVQKLAYSGDGVVWALLNEGIARVQFPSPLSHFEPLLPSGLLFAVPMRHADHLWVFADGQAMRGVYDASGRLERFVNDTPPGRYLFNLTEIDGQFFACNEEGIYIYEDANWRMVLPGIVNARLGVARSASGDIYFLARGEYGVIRRVGADFVAQRIAAPDLGDNYNASVDADGVGWIELGMGKVARLDPHGADPRLQILKIDEDLATGWIEVYLMEGVARFHVGHELLRYDEGRKKVVPDLEMLARYPQFATAGGRPVIDKFGRLWFTANGGVQVVDHSPGGGDRPIQIAPVGFAPTGYTMEDDGVVWMFERRRLARMDLRLATPPGAPLRALISSVEFPASGLQVFAPRGTLKPIDYSDNSLVVHFAAPANPFAAPITFEVMLEGAGTPWVSTGAVGSVTFNRLKEGAYVFRVRPVAGAAGPGAEARLEFVVRPPWYRTGPAWTLYVLGGLGLVAFLTWLSSFMQRRENERLEKLVTKRTGELNATNNRLGLQIQETNEKSAALLISEERYRLLNTELEARVAERTARLTEASGLLEAMLENSPDLIYFKDRSSRFVRFSRACLSHIGLTDPALMRGKCDVDFYAPEHAQAAHADEQEIIRTGEPIVGKLEKEIHADGRVTWVLTTKMPWRDGSGAIVGSFGISKDVTAWKTAEAQLAETHQQLMEASREAGMAEVATGVLHNVGNVLNSVNVSATLVADHVRASNAKGVAKVAALLAQHQADLADFLANDPRGRMVPDYLNTLAETIAHEQIALLAEIDDLQKNVGHIKEIVAMQQSYARNCGVLENVAVPDLIEDALRMNADSLARYGVTLVRDYQLRPVVTTDRHKVIQILINLVRNATFACEESGRSDKKITVRLTGGADGIQIAVADNGVGIPAENLTRIFNHGFTTRKEGHGFGLHSGALAAKEIGGALTVQSDGPGRGATFILKLAALAPADASLTRAPWAEKSPAFSR